MKTCKDSNNHIHILFVSTGCSAKQVTNCALLDANIERSNKGAKSNGSFKYGQGDEAVSMTFDYDRQKLDNGDYQGKIKGDINGKQFTGEVLVKKNSELDVKINLPERVIQFNKALVSNGFKYTLLPNAVKDKAHEHTLQITSNKSAAKKSTKIQMTHPSFKRPLKIDVDTNRKSVSVVLDVANDEKKKLNLYLYNYAEDETMKVGARFYREDQKIDFGFSEERLLKSDKKTTRALIKRLQFWVDKNGKNQTVTRNEEVEVLTDATGTVFDMTSKSLFQTLSYYFQMNGKIHLDLKQRLANGIYDWAINKEKKKTEFDYKNKCLKIDSYDLPKDGYKSNHLISLCTMARSDDQDLVKFEYVQPQLDRKKNLKNVEQLLFRLSKAEEQHLRLTMHWNPELIGEWIVGLSEFVEEQEKMNNEELAKFQSELEHKYNLLKDSLMNDVVLPMRKHRQDEFNAIVNEINPKLAAKLRSKRAIAAKNAANKNNTEVGFLSFSENLAKKLFDFKVVKFSPEEGQIEVLFKAHPSFEGSLYPFVV